MGNKENKSRKSRKRKFCGNQYTNKEININSEPKILTTLNEAGSENLVTWLLKMQINLIKLMITTVYQVQPARKS